jgi:hypothetical protein
MLIEFDPKHPFFRPPGKTPGLDFGTLTKVVYSRTRPRRTFKDKDKIAALPMVKTKSEDWAYEKEWRIFELLENSDEKDVKQTETIHLFCLPSKSIKRVILGCCMDAASRAKLIEAVRANSNLSHVQICQANLDNEKFDLTYSPIDFL